MIHNIVLPWPIINLDSDLNLKETKGDSIIFNVTIDALDLTGWKIFCEVYDLNTSIKLASAGPSGYVPTITLESPPSGMGKFQIVVPHGSTGTFQQFGQIEVELMDPDGNLFTIINQQIWFVNERIIWTNPLTGGNQ
jgi:hypothetical protein